MSHEPVNASRPSDEELMEGVRRQDPEALSQLYDRYSGVLKALAMRIVHNEAESEDLLQEIYMDIWNHSQNYAQERGKALGWMVTLTRRRSIDRCGSGSATRAWRNGFSTRRSSSPAVESSFGRR
jgi:RNA polymerase sigma factor (sigma-70 family)